MSELRFRAFTPADRSDCEAAFDSNVGATFSEKSRRDFQKYLRSSSAHYCVVEKDGSGVIACGGCKVDSWGIAWFDWGLVHRTNQRIGVGRFLLEQRVALARSSPHCWCILLEAVAASVSFYERHGFLRIRSDARSDKYTPLRMMLKEQG